MSQPLISICVNVDTRSQKDIADSMFSGTCNIDYLTDGLRNKKLFFEGFDTELIVFVDKHTEIPEDTLRYMQEICDTLVIRKHTNEPHFNDKNYLETLQLCRGKYVAHWDQDTAGFTSSPQYVQNLIDLLEKYSYVSYPSHWSPRAVNDPSFDFDWASTRFFMCKRETLDFTELRKCLEDYDYWRTTYPVSRICHWTEHLLGSIAKYKGNGVYYPPMDIDNYAIFSWGSYERWTLRRLNELPYSEIRQWLNAHPINYPNDVNC